MDTLWRSHAFSDYDIDTFRFDSGEPGAGYTRLYTDASLKVCAAWVLNKDFSNVRVPGTARSLA
jgi:hypothetical protein